MTNGEDVMGDRGLDGGKGWNFGLKGVVVLLEGGVFGGELVVSRLHQLQTITERAHFCQRADQQLVPVGVDTIALIHWVGCGAADGCVGNERAGESRRPNEVEAEELAMRLVCGILGRRARGAGGLACREPGIDG